MRSPPHHARRAAARPALVALLALVATLGVAACDGAPRPADATARDAAAQAVRVVDDGGHELRLAAPARRVVSLVPSGTDIVVALGALDRLVGRTRYDTGAEVAAVPSVGGGLDPSIEALVALRPDLVLLWESEQRTPLRAQLDAAGIAAFGMRTTDTTDVYAALERLGALLGRPAAADSVAAAARAELEAVRRSVAGVEPRRVLYVVGISPPMTAGPHTFVGQLLTLAGGRTVFDDVAQPWPTVAIEEVVRRAPDVVVLPVGEESADPAATLRATAGWRELAAVREGGGRLVTVPAELMNRPGPGMGRAARLLRDALHPELAGGR